MLRTYWLSLCSGRSVTCRLTLTFRLPRHFRRTVSFVLSLVLLSSGLTLADTTLYTLNTTGSLWSIDLQSGSTSPTDFAALGAGSWNGLTPSAVESNVLYAVNNERPATLDDPSFSRLVQIDLNTGTSMPFPLFDNEVLGSPSIVSSGIAISPLEPGVAFIAGNDTGFPPNPYLYRVDTTTGEVLETATSLTNVRRLESLTFSLDGSTLYGANEEGELVTIDTQTGEVAEIGSPGLSDFLTGLAFQPNDETLYAIDGLRSDQLIRMDASTGALIDIVGPLGIGGPEGLAFVTVNADPLDCSGDGLVDVADLACSNAADTTPELLLQLNLLEGDFDGQNGVDFNDFLNLANNYGQPLDRYIDGDIDDNGIVEFADFLRLAANYGQTSSASVAAVPEPTGWTMVAFATLAGFVLFRRRS